VKPEPATAVEILPATGFQSRIKNFESAIPAPPAEDVKKVERRLTSEEKKSLKKPDVLKQNKKP